MRKIQSGFTLTELMIATGLSLSIISSVLIGYLAIYTGSLSTLAGSKLNQDMGSLMDLMASELRRAGYTSSAPAHATSNPFNQPGKTAPTVFNTMAANLRQSATGSGSCIVYSYDMDEDGVIDAAELTGFRLTPAGTVQMRTTGNAANPNTCATASNTWTELTDPQFIKVSALTFDLGNSACVNTREPDGIDNDADNSVDEAAEADCYASVPDTGSGDITVETREATITLTATLAADTFVRLTQTRNVRVRNELVAVR